MRVGDVYRVRFGAKTGYFTILEKIENYTHLQNIYWFRVHRSFDGIEIATHTLLALTGTEVKSLLEEVKYDDN